MGGVLTFLFVTCISRIVFGDFYQSEHEELVTRFDRYRRQAQIRGPGVVASKVLNYFFDAHISPDAKELFLKAKKSWEKETCVKFIENEQAANKILVTDQGTKCLFKRYQDGKGLQTLYLGCGYYGGAAHEIGHALWLDHTHNRHDRDLYLDVNDENIRREYYSVANNYPGLTPQIYAQQYKKLTTSQNENYGLPYDYGSIMHYGSSGPNPTMTPKDKKYHRTTGSPLISFTDLAMVNKHFNCEVKCARDPSSAKCANHGFPNPNNCRICVCPSGYGGPLCEDKPDKCGQVLNATKTWKNVAREIYNKKVHGDYFRCTNWIKGTSMRGAQRVYLKRGNRVNPIVTEAPSTACLSRFCSEDDVGMKLKSESNLVPFITYSMHTINKLHVKLRYRYVQ